MYKSVEMLNRNCTVEEIKNNIITRNKNILNNMKNIIIFGAGKMGINILNIARRENISVVAFSGEMYTRYKGYFN